MRGGSRCGLPPGHAAHCPPTGPCSSHARLGLVCPKRPVPKLVAVLRPPGNAPAFSLGRNYSTARGPADAPPTAPAGAQLAGSGFLSPFIFVCALAPGGKPGRIVWVGASEQGRGLCALSCEGLGVEGPVGGLTWRLMRSSEGRTCWSVLSSTSWEPRGLSSAGGSWRDTLPGLLEELRDGGCYWSAMLGHRLPRGSGACASSFYYFHGFGGHKSGPGSVGSLGSGRHRLPRSLRRAGPTSWWAVGQVSLSPLPMGLSMEHPCDVAVGFFGACEPEWRGWQPALVQGAARSGLRPQRSRVGVRGASPRAFLPDHGAGLLAWVPQVTSTCRLCHVAFRSFARL